MIKKIISFSLAVMLLTSSLSVSAKTISIDQQLADKGVPAGLIQTMPEEQKEDIIRNTIKFISYKNVSYSEPKDNRLISPRTISDSDMDFSVSAYSVSAVNNRERIRIYCSYNWKNEPTWRLTDPFGVAWDNSKWRPVSGTSNQYTYWVSEVDDTHYSESSTALAYASSAGVGWDTDLRALC